MQNHFNEVNDTDLDAFEPATHAQLQAGELGKIKAFIPNLEPNAPVPESMGKSSHNNAPLESQCSASSHKQSDSDDSLEDLKKSTEWIFQGSLFFGSNGWCTGETYEADVQAVVEQQYLPKVPHGNFLSFSGRTWQGSFENTDSRLCAGEFCKPTTVEKLERCSWFEAKAHGWVWSKGTW